MQENVWKQIFIFSEICLTYYTDETVLLQEKWKILFGTSRFQKKQKQNINIKGGCNSSVNVFLSYSYSSEKRVLKVLNYSFELYMPVTINVAGKYPAMQMIFRK